MIGEGVSRGMIIKEWEREDSARDKYAAAGAEAERQLAHYLKRKFADRKDVLVFNNLRFEDEGGDDAAQIDHLIFHRHGFIIVESKSVTSKVKINERGEWQRLWNGHYEGMPSPLLQAQRQADFLKKILNRHKDSLRNKVFLLNRSANFNVCPFEILVAISDRGIIDGKVLEGVCKADQIPDEVEKIIHRHKTAAFRLSLKDGADKFPDEEMDRIAKFLVEMHKPRSAQESVKNSVPAIKGENERPSPMTEVIPIMSPLAMIEAEMQSKVETATAATPQATLCPACNTDRVHILYGQYGYYYRCQACGKSFNIDFTCPQCGIKAKIRKEKEQFFMECGGCNRRELHHVNQ